jgi:AraC family transcriptional regulator
MTLPAPTIPVLTGKELRTRSAGPFEVTLVEHRPGLRLEKHRHAEAVIGLLLDGVYDEWLDGRTVEPMRASLLIKPPETPHANRIGRTGTHTVLIQVRPNAIPAELAGVLATPAIHIDAKVAAIGELFVAELRNPGGPSALALEALAYELLGLAERRGAKRGAGYSRTQRWVTRVREFLHAEAEAGASRATSLAALAQAAGVDRAHLARAFRQVFGCTVGEYVRSVRIGRAAAMLRSSREPVGRIAAESGFADQSHLTNHFRSAYGVTPRGYRLARSGVCTPQH